MNTSILVCSRSKSSIYTNWVGPNTGVEGVVGEPLEENYVDPWETTAKTSNGGISTGGIY